MSLYLPHKVANLLNFLRFSILSEHLSQLVSTVIFLDLRICTLCIVIVLFARIYRLLAINQLTQCPPLFAYKSIGLKHVRLLESLFLACVLLLMYVSSIPRQSLNLRRISSYFFYFQIYKFVIPIYIYIY